MPSNIVYLHTIRAARAAHGIARPKKNGTHFHGFGRIDGYEVHDIVEGVCAKKESAVPFCVFLKSQKVQGVEVQGFGYGE